MHLPSFYYEKHNPNKISLLKCETRHFDHPKLYYYDHIFDTYNWSIEPTESLLSLYKNRAQKLRDTFPYLVLAYSGGIDSTNILETFYYNKIHIDEILIVGAFSRDSYMGSDDNHNGEIYFNSFPTLKKLKLSGTKITIIDYTRNLQALSLVNQDDWFLKIGSWWSIHNWYWYDLEVQYTKDNIVGIIFGLDKPRIRLYENKFYFCFEDRALYAYGYSPSKIVDKNNVKRINFYWDPEATNIIIKQCHIIADYFYSHFYEAEYAAYCNTIHNLIYPNIENKLRFISKKSISTISSLRDSYMHKIPDFKDTKIYKNYSQGIHKMLSINDSFHNLSIKSKEYWIT